MMFDVCGIGNTLMDYLVKVKEEELAKLGMKKGVFHLLEEGKTQEIVDKFNHYRIVPAGATTNTLMGIAALGGKCVLLGKVGSGEVGQMYEEIIKKEGIIPKLAKAKTARTGKALTFVTPDAERTFGVHLGAAIRLEPKSVADDDIKNSKFLYFTGYELESVNATVHHAITIAKDNKVKIALDLADPDLITRNLEEIKNLVKDVDIVFMNEHEALSFTGLEPQEAAAEVGRNVETVIVKIGAQGSLVMHQQKLYRIESEKVDAVDTTGAGDLYAAGFLYSVIQNKNPQESGKIGSVMGAKIVSQMGAKLTDRSKKELQNTIFR